MATSATFTANATAGGPYNVVASATGATSANFSLTNTAGPPARITLTTDSHPSEPHKPSNAAPLLLPENNTRNNPVSGVVAHFTAPASGVFLMIRHRPRSTPFPYTTLFRTATSATFTANATAGGPYNVVASATGATSANFSMTNTASAPASIKLVQHTSLDLQEIGRASCRERV